MHNHHYPFISTDDNPHGTFFSFVHSGRQELCGNFPRLCALMARLGHARVVFWGECQPWINKPGWEKLGTIEVSDL